MYPNEKGTLLYIETKTINKMNIKYLHKIIYFWYVYDASKINSTGFNHLFVEKYPIKEDKCR